jgi:hypothetical protein
MNKMRVYKYRYMQVFTLYVRGREVRNRLTVGMKDVEELHEKQN